MEEIWKDIKGYEDLYQVSNLGKIKSLKQMICCWNGHKIIQYEMPEKILSQRIRSNYYAVGLTKNKKQKTYSVHRLVAQAFIPNPENKKCINHKDENKLNNKVENLEWCDIAYNNAYGTRTKKTCKHVHCIETGLIYESTVEAQKHTGINRVYITNVCNKKHKTAGGYHWEYIK